MTELKKFFRPEMINRIDDIVVYDVIGEDALRKIVDLELEHVQELLLAKGVEASFDDSVAEHLMKVGYDPEFGARPLKRAVTKYVVNPLSVKMLEGEVGEGRKVKVKVEKGELQVVISQ